MLGRQRAIGPDSTFRRSLRNAQRRLLSQDSLTPEPARVRSVGRTWLGIGMMAGGLGMALYNQECALVGPRSDSFTLIGQTFEWTYRAIERDGECWVGGTAGIRGEDGEFLDGGEELDLQRSYSNFAGDDTTAKQGRGALSKSVRFTGVGLAAAGALVAIFWSDVAPAPVQDIDVRVQPDGSWLVSRAIGW